MTEFVTFRSGVTVQVEAVVLALALENAGHALTAKDGKLMVSNGARLTAEQRASIQRLRLHLLAIAAEGSEVEAPALADEGWGREVTPPPDPRLAARAPRTVRPRAARERTDRLRSGRENARGLFSEETA